VRSQKSSFKGPCSGFKVPGSRFEVQREEPAVWGQPALTGNWKLETGNRLIELDGMPDHPVLSLVMNAIISVTNLSKTYASGFRALKNVNLDIRQGEIFALLGPNGAGKTTLIGTICGIVTPGAGTILVDGHNIATDQRAARAIIGLVPQELTTDAFETP